MAMTTRKAAEELGITEGAVRQLVHRGKLTPERRGAKPLRFPAAEIWNLKRARNQPAAVAETNALWDLAEAIAAE